MINFRTIVSGSSGNCTFFSDGTNNILIDCGLSGKKIAEHLCNLNINPNKINAIFVTHEHTDHTVGVGVLSRKYDIPVVASEGTWDGMKIGNIPLKNCIVQKPDLPVCINGLLINPFAIPHDANQPTGYTIECENQKFAIATDMGHISDDVFDTINGCYATVIESNYDEQMLNHSSYPLYLKERIHGKLGHLDNKDAATLAYRLVKSGTKHIILGHLSNENNSPEIAFSSVAKELELNEFHVGRDIQLSVAPRYCASENICVNF